MRRVILICGPPCGGKTTYVQQRAAPGDLILDQDEIARTLGSSREWLHTQHVSRRANRHMRAGIAQVAAMTEGRAWVIRCLAGPGRRAALADYLKADEVIVLMPPIDETLRRAQTRPGPNRTTALVRRWYAAYQPAPCDTLTT